jgi:hypothetical protein
LNKGKIAATKTDYIIKPVKMKQLYQFWNDVDNEFMKKVRFDERSFRVLPKNTVSPEVYFLDNDKHEKVNEVDSEAKKNKKRIATTREISSRRNQFDDDFVYCYN